MKKWIASAILLLVLSLVITACGQSSTPNSSPPQKSGTTAPTVSTPAAAQPQSGGTLKIIVRVTMGQLGSPAEGSATYYPMTAGPAMENLFRLDRDWNAITTNWSLVESFDTSSDGKTITLHLRKGVKFQDGTPFNSEAAKYNLSNYAPSKVPPEFLKNVASYETPDENTLKITLKSFDAYFLTNVGRGNAGIMDSVTALKNPSSPSTLAKDHLVGTGPFKFVSWQGDTYAKYQKAESYWAKGMPYLDAIEFSQVVDPSTSMMSFKNGEAQVLVGITPREANELETAGFQIVISDTMPPVAVMTPDAGNADSPWANIKVRQAAEYAIDKKTLANGLGGKYYTPINQFSISQKYFSTPNPQNRTYDPAKARQLLAEAGYPNGFKTTLFVQISTSKDLAGALQDNLKAVGIDAQIDSVEATRWTSFYKDGWKNGLVLHPSMGVNLQGMKNYFGTIGSGSLTYPSALRPSGYTEKLDAALSQPDAAKRAVQEDELVKIMSDNAMTIPLYISTFLAAQSKNVHDLDWGVGGNYSFTPHKAWLSK
jgi:peptide/nickel transport system substrate-binding protein